MSDTTTRQRKQRAAEVVVDAAKSVEKTVENALTVLWADLPSWQQDNHFIHSGYRPESKSFARSFGSLAYLHNESVNIYSHLVGAVVFSAVGGILYWTIKPRYQSAGSSDILAFSCFFLGAALCLGISGTYHAISNHSPIVARYGNKLDYVGIVLDITGSFIPSIFYGFYCHPHLLEFYGTMICLLGLGCTAVSIFDRFRTPAWRPYRAGMFVLMGMSAIFPVLHELELYGFPETQRRVGLNWLLLQGFFYILGAGIYAFRWPERSWPGSFDIWGSSHQIFHVLVLMAAASHLYGLIQAFDYRHGVLGLQC